MNVSRSIAAVALLVIVVACRAAVPKPSPGESLFSSPALPRFQIQIATDEYEKLRRDYYTYVRATVMVGTNTFRDVGVRLKGHGSFRPLNDKPSLTLNFDEFRSGQKLDGLTKVLLNNASQDTSLMSEYIAAGMFRDAGVPVARVTHARVHLNDRNLGFYVLAEGMNKIFLKQQFGSAKGALYDVNAFDINQRLQQSNGEPSDQADVAALVAAAQRAPGDNAKALREALDVDRFFSFLAISVLGAQHDSYPLNRNNYRLYRDPASQRFVMMPHGIDGSFSRNAMPIALPGKYVLTRAITQTPELNEAFQQRVGELFTNVFKLEVLTNRLLAASLRLQSAATNELERAGIATRANGFARRLADRHQNVADQLAGISVALVTLNPGATLQLTNWRGEVNRGTATFQQSDAGGKRSLHIYTGPGDNHASWRQWTMLAPGNYRFRGNVRVVMNDKEASPGIKGVGVRISGRSAPVRMPVNNEWTSMELSFVVREGEEQVQFICEARGSNIEACFDADSLMLQRE